MIQKVTKMLLVLCFFGFQTIFAQTTVTGIIKDAADGTTLPGVNIIEKGTSNGVTSDFNGKYSIEVSEGATLQFSFIGYTPKEIAVKNQTVINLSLAQSAEALDEVVITALGISREKKSLGYAITELKSDEINTVKDHNVANSLVGKVAGVVVNQSGGVGAGSRITIRGNNTITGNNQALIVVDGIPIDVNGSESGGGVYSSTVTGGGITDINPEDVESVSVLKGPNAAALYGSRAASGVLLITTKKGSKGRGLGISINSNMTVENTMFLPEFQNVYGQGTNGATATLDSDPTDGIYSLSGSSWGPEMDGSQQLYFTEEGAMAAYTAQPDNVKDFFETGIKSINSISLDKGGDEYSVRFSYTNNATKSILPNSDLNSHNFNLRALYDLNDKLSFDAKATYFTQDLNNRVSLGSEGVLAYVFGMPRNINVNDLENHIQKENPSLYVPGVDTDYDVISYTGVGNSTGNPYWMLNKDSNQERRGRFLGFAKMNYEFNDWLSGFIRVGSDIANVRSEGVKQVGHHFTRYGSFSSSTRKNTEFNADFLFTANKDLTEKLNLAANVGGNLSKRTYEAVSVSGSQFKIPTRAFLANTNIQTNNHTPLQTKKVNSIYGSFNFAYDNFMYLDVTARNDWSSTLSEDNRSYFYPSLNYAILVDKFIDPEHKKFDYLKLRASWAQVGNDTGVYQLTQTFSVPSIGYLGLTTLNAPTIKLNPDLKPESVSSMEFGLEARMFGNRLYADFSTYKITTTDMIFDIDAPSGSVYQYLRENVGEVENNGVEFLIGGIPVRTDDFSWDVSLNFSKNKNKLVELIDGLDNTVLNNSNTGNLSIRAEVGGGIGDIYGPVWKTDDAGNLLVSAEGRPLASTSAEYLGNAQPDWIGGLTNTLSYKNFSLRFLIDGRFGGEVYSATSASLDLAGNSERSLAFREGGIVIDAINEGTGLANTENITAQEYWTSYAGIASHYVYDQTNVRLREFALNYNVPSETVQKLGLTGASIGLIGRNLFFLYRKADDIDPESTLGTGLSGQGISLNNIPTIRSLGLNINLKF
ncbi:SusC/RagA family TonB-linked outer membrane protein [Aureibaculum sp. A20]|uniref:SusC/RagA family TonB-linked outer membrane protein n=1 Tax=Aureibaculum flavum TaxID=2795986 RepID=A0ABS0WRV3_9FLAO|nr:SusC/RagA family TonB-linked outer membrane protein [Aureibaculum flavum]MBJ2174664.1 SusC/RagA family TonB-linked outer membrane protein [Aureibaculum flavum]